MLMRATWRGRIRIVILLGELYQNWMSWEVWRGRSLHNICEDKSSLCVTTNPVKNLQVVFLASRRHLEWRCQQ
jgi:hypothetical protein